MRAPKGVSLRWCGRAKWRFDLTHKNSRSPVDPASIRGLVDNQRNLRHPELATAIGPQVSLRACPFLYSLYEFSAERRWLANYGVR
jgi:hypothetical protein